MRDDARRWDERYATVTAASPQPPEILERWPDLVTLIPSSGRCVDVACGPGAVTLWLAGRGLDVTALDVSTRAIDLLRRTAAGCEPPLRVDARVVDLDDGLPNDLVDLDLVVCQRFRDRSLYPVMVERLRPGGMALVSVLSEVGARRPGPFHAPPGELHTSFSGPACTIVRESEADGVAHVVVRRR